MAFSKGDVVFFIYHTLVSLYVITEESTTIILTLDPQFSCFFFFSYFSLSSVTTTSVLCVAVRLNLTLLALYVLISVTFHFSSTCARGADA